MNPQNSSLFPDPSLAPVVNNKKRKYNDNDDMMAFGYECKVYNEEKVAIDIENGKYLIPWKSLGSSQVMMDRYDVRHLIEKEDTMKKNQVVLDKEYDKERYQDLIVSKQDESRNKATIPYEYDKKVTEFEKETRKKYATPESILGVPETKEQLDVMLNVSNEIKQCKNGNLLEIKIQVKHTRDPLYSFLNKQDVLYPFYKHLIGYTCLVAYSDSSDSDNEEEEISMETKDRIDAITTSIVKSKDSTKLQEYLTKMKGYEENYSFLNRGNIHYQYFQSEIKRKRKEGL